MSSASPVDNSAISLADSPVHGQESVPFEAMPTDARAVSKTNCSASVTQATKRQQQDAIEPETRMEAEINDRRYRWFRAFWLSDTPLEEIGEDFLNARNAREFDAAIDRAMLDAPRGSEV